MKVIKRNGLIEIFDGEKIKKAVMKSAERVNTVLSGEELSYLIFLVNKGLKGAKQISVDIVHNVVEMSLDKINVDVAKSYKDYRNWKKEYGEYLIKDIERQVHSVLNDVDRSNSNSNSRYISTKRTDIAKTFSKEMYQKMFLSKDVLKAMKDGYIYIHDLSDMLVPQLNCHLIDMKSILNGGFNLEGYYYVEPKNIRVAVGQVSDIIMITSAQHFGGSTTPEIDKVLAPYYKMTIQSLEKEYREMGVSDWATRAQEKAYNELKQSLQGLEIKLNTVVSARGSFPFSTFTFGDCDNGYEKDVARAILQVRLEGHGKKGFKKHTIFPKLVFLYNKDKHGKNGELEDLFEYSIQCSSKCMYPDYIANYGDNHYREGKWVSPMGCRAYLSNYRDEKTGELVFVGRANIGAISLHLPMIYMQAKEENKNFFELLDYYLQMIRKLHINRYEYLGKAKASSNPLMFCEGGYYGGNLNPDDEIKPLLKYWTASFGITALNELEVLASGHRLVDGNEFSLEVMNHIEKRVNEFKEKDGWMYAIYNTPKLCGWV